MLNAYNPGISIAGSLVVFSHVFMKNGRCIRFQFGVNNFRFVFTLDGDLGTFYQVPVDADLFHDAENGKLRPLDV